MNLNRDLSGYVVILDHRWIILLAVALVLGLSGCAETPQPKVHLAVDVEIAEALPPDIAVDYLLNNRNPGDWRDCKYDPQGAVLYQTFEFSDILYDEDDIKTAQRNAARVDYKSLYANSFIWLNQYFLVITDSRRGNFGDLAHKHCRAFFVYAKGDGTVHSFVRERAGKIMTALKSLGVTVRNTR